MNRRFRLPSALGIAVLLAVSLAYANGCKSTATPARKAYTTISDAVSAAQQAMLAFNDRYQSGLATEAQRTKALGYYADFQAVARTAVTLSKDVTQQANALQIASDAASNLLALLAQLLPTAAAPTAIPPVSTSAPAATTGGV
jgi:rhamnose utilization protein RhaD (predicted bifunctional aldolase and dehydrogenase)